MAAESSPTEASCRSATVAALPIPGSGFLTIGYTLPDPPPGESGIITRLLSEGCIDLMHLRHPGRPASLLRDIIYGIPEELRWRITLHDGFTDIPAGCFGGIHLNSRNPEIPEALLPLVGRLRISRSCHSIEELRGCCGLTYVTLSPVFDSISKSGYRSAFSTHDLREAVSISAITGVPLIALGGVSRQKFRQLRDAGFAGAAMLGSLWREIPPESAERQIIYPV